MGQVDRTATTTRGPQGADDEQDAEEHGGVGREPRQRRGPVRRRTGSAPTVAEGADGGEAEEDPGDHGSARRKGIDRRTVSPTVALHSGSVTATAAIAGRFTSSVPPNSRASVGSSTTAASHRAVATAAIGRWRRRSARRRSSRVTVSAATSTAKAG